MNPDGLQKLII